MHTYLKKNKRIEEIIIKIEFILETIKFSSFLLINKPRYTTSILFI